MLGPAISSAGGIARIVFRRGRYRAQAARAYAPPPSPLAGRRATTIRPIGRSPAGQGAPRRKRTGFATARRRGGDGARFDDGRTTGNTPPTSSHSVTRQVTQLGSTRRE